MFKTVFKIVTILCFYSLVCVASGDEKQKEYLHFYAPPLTGDTDFITKKLANGGSEIFTDAIALNTLKDELNAFNDTANVNLHVFYGRVFLDYERLDWEELVTPNEKAAIQFAFKKMNQTSGYAGATNTSSVLETIKPVYNEYLSEANNKASVLFVYVEAYIYNLRQSTANAPKWEKRKIYGFVNSTDLSSGESLKLNYVKSLHNSIAVTIPTNSENKPDAQYLIKTYVEKYIEEHNKPLILKNPNCPKCPLNPAANANYWDNSGRLWRYTKTNCNDTNWVDLSYEYSNTPCGNDSWKQGVDVQYVHQQYYETKINSLKKYPLQQLAGGVTPELEKSIWRATQIATVYALKDEYVSNEVGWQGWVPFWGSALTGYYQVQIANGDLNLQLEAGFNFVMAAADIGLVKGIATGAAKAVIGVRRWIIDGGIKIAAKNAYYRVGKAIASYKLGYTLSNATIEGTTLFEKQLANGVEVVDEVSKKYLKYDRYSGDVLVGKFSDNAEKEILFEKNGKLYNAPQNASDEALAEWVINNVNNVVSGVGLFNVGDNIAGKIVQKVRVGTNGKIAVIGRKMEGHVNDVVTTLESQGKQVEAFNDAYQSGKLFNINGQNYSWEQVKLDFGNSNGQYLTNSQGYILDSEIPNTLIYKANQQWVQKLINQGYEVIDMGYPVGQNIDPSLFYNMELTTLFP